MNTLGFTNAIASLADVIASTLSSGCALTHFHDHMDPRTKRSSLYLYFEGYAIQLSERRGIQMIGVCSLHGQTIFSQVWECSCHILVEAVSRPIRAMKKLCDSYDAAGPPARRNSISVNL